MKGTLRRLFALMMCALLLMQAAPAALGEAVEAAPAAEAANAGDLIVEIEEVIEDDAPSGEVDTGDAAVQPALPEAEALVVALEDGDGSQPNDDDREDEGPIASLDDVISLQDAIPDAGFRAWAAANIDVDPADGVLSESEIAAVTDITLPAGTAGSLEGIGLFTGLQTLTCADNAIGALDLSGNPGLIAVNCANCGLTELDLSNNAQLTTLDCSGNAIPVLDVRPVSAFAQGAGSLTCDESTFVLDSAPYTMTADASKSIATQETLVIDFGGSALKSIANSAPTCASAVNAGKYAVVKGLANGTAKLTFALPGKKLVLTLKVVDPTLPTQIKLNKTGTLKRYVGAKVQLKASIVKPDTAYTTYKWKSSNTKVCTVSSSGKVTMKGVGTATVTATAVRGRKTASVKFKVLDPNVVTGIKLNKSKAKVPVCTTYKLKATVKYAGGSLATKKAKVTWKSSNTKVATVNSSGVVTAKKTGTTTITASTKNGKKATCKVTVRRNKVDNIWRRPTMIDVGDLGYDWDMWCKSVEIVSPNKVVMECYVLNNTMRRITRFDKVEMQLSFEKDGVTRYLVKGRSGRQKVTVPPYTWKKVTLTFTGKLVKYTNLNLSALKDTFWWDWYVNYTYVL